MFLPSGKQERPSLGSQGGGTKMINRLYLSDGTFKSKYLIDTGVDVSVVHLTAASKHHPPASLQLFSANGTSKDSTAAFEKCKKDLAEAPVLYHPGADALLAIVVDASDTTIGAALYQQGSYILTVSTCECISVCKKRDRKIRTTKLSIRARTHRSCGTPTSIRESSLLPHLCGSVLQMARSISTGRDFSRGRGQGLYTYWITRLGPPLRLTADQRTQFESSLFETLSKFLGTEKQPKTPYHPAANGQVERFHRQLKVAIMAHGSAQWTTILLGYRATWKEDLQDTTAEKIYRAPIRLFGEFLCPSKQDADPATFVGRLRESMQRQISSNNSHHGKNTIFVSKDLTTCSHIFLRTDSMKKGLQLPYEVPIKQHEGYLRRTS
ncbi:retrovirus-related Pol polyprotein from transposon 412 [Nephila pilipes]|uniref:Retrovirus-related Pol polyprotein from transposon 412 n=1 Tax=Nephila pilipes TaxID=299642 RepID=A0A8X6NDV2_NEPPI|nr:retrovirus-related Pol polyprotein from transposon 412 [Nephila pilipes]